MKYILYRHTAFTKESRKIHMKAKKISILKKAALTIAAATFSVMIANTAYACDDCDDPYHVIEEMPETKFVTTVGALRLRTGASLESAIIRNMPLYTVLEVANFNPYSEFTAVIANGTHGYAATRYIAPASVVFTDITDLPAPTTAFASAQTPNGTVELLPWSYIRTIMPTGTNISIYDVRTGLTYTVRNFSNGNHADVETLTQTDTNIMRQSSGGRYSWDPRSVLATFTDNSGNVRTVAAAINTMPHAGWTIAGNGMNGHICLHFYQSRTHNGNRNYETAMQAAVRTAFNR